MSTRMMSSLVALALLVSNCASDGGESTTTPPPATSSTTTSSTSTTGSEVTTTTTALPAVEERWFEISGNGFVDSRTGEPFVPSGVNLLLKLGGGGGDQMFAVYDPLWVDEQLTGIADLGFNTVRFFLDMCMSCTTDGDGVRDDYLDNLADLLTRLEAHGLAAFPTSNDVPDPGFSERLPCCEPFGGYRNSLYLSEEGHRIAVEYWTELIEGVKDRGAPTHHLLGWQLANEQFVLRDVAPITLTTGEVTTADGTTYDLADDAAVADMVTSNLRAFVTTVGDAIREIDEGALISMGFFSADEPGVGRAAADNRWVVPEHMIEESSLDFIDLHAYPGLGGTWPGIAAAYGLTGEPVATPLILGEYGAFEQAYPDPADAAAAMARWQAGSCDWGFEGWLLWFWGADRDDEVITADAFDATVGRAVSPLVRPDPCDAADFTSDNLALGRPVTASAVESDEYPAGHVNDGSDATWWSAAEGPPQWVEIELAQPSTVARVEILIGDVSPPGPQTHEIWVRGDDDVETFVGEVSADARQGDWLTVDLDPAAEAQWVRVETVAMDGWVIIHEVKILGE